MKILIASLHCYATQGLIRTLLNFQLHNDNVSQLNSASFDRKICRRSDPVFVVQQPSAAAGAVDINDQFCGLPDNVGIETKYPYEAETNFTSHEHITAIRIVFSESNTVAIMGTSSGHLLKVRTCLHRLAIFLFI